MKKISLSTLFMAASLFVAGSLIPYNSTSVSENSLTDIDRAVIQSRHASAIYHREITSLTQETKEYISLSNKWRIGFNVAHTVLILGAGVYGTLAFTRRKEENPTEPKTAEPKL